MAVSRRGSLPPMRMPLTYVIDYSRRFLDDEKNILAFADAPPDLMHVGKSVPILHNWGPVPLIHGENQYTGGPGHTLDINAIRLLTPQELEERIALLKAYTAKWHSIGVRFLIPYSAIHTIAGDHEKREGFWKFYDHWDDYARWLGPKPKSDPTEWLGVDREGKILPGVCGGFSPKYYAPLHRYQCCSRHPDWRAFQARLTELIAEVGYDGVFPDNSSVHDIDSCYCRHCQAAFRQFVRRMTLAQLEMLGAPDGAATLDLLDPDLPREILRRFRITTVAEYQSWVRAAGRRVNPDFRVFPNVNSFEVFMPISEHCDFLMFESTYMPGCTIAQVPEGEGYVTIQVVPDVSAGEMGEFYLSVLDRETPARLAALVRFPRAVRPGNRVELAARIEKVGLQYGPVEIAEDFEFILTDAAGREERIALQPHGAVSSHSSRSDIRRTPVELQAQWMPARPGVYRLSFAHRHTNENHPESATRKQIRSEMCWQTLYQTHIGQLLFTMHAGAQTVSLDYESRSSGKEAVQELCLAENAAFSSGSATAVSGEPLRKYVRFFRRTRHLYEGMLPYADIALLYGYWGYNPETLAYGHAQQEITPSVDLAARHRLFLVLMDKTFNQADLNLLRTLILCGQRLEMGEAQVGIIRKFVEEAGRLYLYRPDTTINGKPVREVLGKVNLWQPGLRVPGMAPLLVSAVGPARGLRFSAFVAGGERRLVLHAVNFNVACRETPPKATPVEGATVTLPLPERWKPARATIYDPDCEDAAPLSIQFKAGKLTFTLPTVRIYKVVEISAK